MSKYTIEGVTSYVKLGKGMPAAMARWAVARIKELEGERNGLPTDQKVRGNSVKKKSRAKTGGTNRKAKTGKSTPKIQAAD